MPNPIFIAQVEVQDHQGAPMASIEIEAIDADAIHTSYPGGPAHYEDGIAAVKTSDNQGLVTFDNLAHPRHWFRPRIHRHPDVRIQVLSYAPGQVTTDTASVSIAAGKLPIKTYYCGPWMGENGAIYSPILTVADLPTVFKSTDGGATHTEMDSANRPATTALYGLWTAVYNNKI